MVLSKETFTYDSLNRLTSATYGKSGDYTVPTLNWSYDNYGNRCAQFWGASAFSAGGSAASCTSSMWSIGSAASDVPYAAPQSWATYNGNNQVNATTQMPAGFQYDTNGRVTGGGGNTYTYDAEGRITAVSQVGGLFRTTLYIYDAEGRRVAKAFPTGIVPAVVTPDFLHSGAAVSTQYILGKDGEEVSQLDGSGDWLQSNAYYDGQLLATITPDDTLFSLNDWLGTKRVTVGASLCGTAYTQFPFGDGLAANPLVVNGATLTACEELDGHHFTGKERDNESGNDYFGARYYQSNMGRWMIPDWSAAPTAIPYAALYIPQSLNLYQFVQQNPTTYRDRDGHDCPPDCDNLNDSLDGTPLQGHGGQVLGIMASAAATAAGVGELGELVEAAPSLLTGAKIFTTAMGAVGTAVNTVAATSDAAFGTNSESAQDHVTSVTNPVAASVAIATGSAKSGAAAADLKSAGGALSGNAKKLPDAAASLGNAKTALSDAMKSARNFLNPPAPPTPQPPGLPGGCVYGLCGK